MTPRPAMWWLLCGVSALGILGACGHAAPRPSPQVVAAERERRDRLPDDHRTLDGTWDDVRVRVAYKDGQTEATLELRHPKLRFIHEASALDASAPQPKERDKASATTPSSSGKIEQASMVQGRKSSGDAGRTRPDPSRALPDALRQMTPFDIDRIEIHDGEIEFVDMTKPSKPEVWVSELEVSIENVASRPGLAEGRPVLITARAKIQRSGDLAVFVSADPWSDSLNFSGRASIEGLATKELYSFLADTAKFQIPTGTLDLFIAFTAKDGHITGGVKPILQNAEVKPVQSGVFARMKAWAVGTVLSLFSDRVKGRNAVATVVPIKGDLGGPGVKLWPAIASVLYNAYVNGISAGFGGVPAAPSPPASHPATTLVSGGERAP